MSARAAPHRSAAPAAGAARLLQRKCSCERQPEQDERAATVRRSPLAGRGAGRSGQVPDIVHEVLDASGQGLSAAVRDYFEPRLHRDFSHVPLRAAAPQLSRSDPLVLGSPLDASEVEADAFAARHTRPLDPAGPGGRYDLSGVRVHTGARADASARALGARAYAVGRDIVFADGQFAPETAYGRTLLAHELAHVAQQGASVARTLRRSLGGCQELMAAGASRLIPGKLAHSLIQSDFTKVPGALQVAIPGASAAPQRAIGICGEDTSVVNPQTVGGRGGMGYPDLATRNAAGILQVAEIKPAAIECLVDGETQLQTYIDQGNARDPEQLAWKAANGVTVVSPMLPSTYQPPTIHVEVPGVGGAELRTAWCTPGLLAYAVVLTGQKPLPVPVTAPKTVPEAQRSRWREKLIKIGVPAAMVTAVIALVAAALVDPEPVSKIALGLASLLGIGLTGATAMAMLIVKSVGGKEGGDGA
jgi:hypothetical protein